jgi:hypothetical protein
MITTLTSHTPIHQSSFKIQLQSIFTPNFYHPDTHSNTLDNNTTRNTKLNWKEKPHPSIPFTQMLQQMSFL